MSWNEATVLVVMYLGILAVACWFCYESGRSKAMNVWRQEVSDLRQQLTRAHFAQADAEKKYKKLRDAACMVTNHSGYYMDRESYIEFCKLRDLARRG